MKKAEEEKRKKSDNKNNASNKENYCKIKDLVARRHLVTVSNCT